MHPKNELNIKADKLTRMQVVLRSKLMKKLTQKLESNQSRR